MPRIVLCLGEGWIIIIFLKKYTCLIITLVNHEFYLYFSSITPFFQSACLPDTCLYTHNAFLTYPTHVCVHTVSFSPIRHMSVYTQCLSSLPDTCLCTYSVFLLYPTHVCVHRMSVYLPDTCLCTHNVFLLYPTHVCVGTMSICLPDTCLCTHNDFLPYPTHVCVHTMSVCLPDTYICTDNFLSV